MCPLCGKLDRDFLVANSDTFIVFSVRNGNKSSANSEK